MPQYAYTARTADGKDTTGTMAAGNDREIRQALAERSLFVIRLEEVKEKKPLLQLKKGIKTADVASTLTQLADLLENGVPLMDGLEILASQAVTPEVGQILAAVRDDVAEGIPFDEALEKHPAVFSDLTVSMVRAGAEGAFLEDALKRISDFLELQEELKGRVVGAMFYPAFLMALGIIVTIGLVAFLVPKFAEMFQQMEEEGGLPMATVVLLALSDFLRHYGWAVALGAIGLVVWLKNLVRTPGGKSFMDKWKIRVPIFGPIFLNMALSRFCRVLGTLLKNGVPLLKSLDISSASTGNSILAQTVLDSAENISSGDTLSRPLAASKLFPNSVMAMITIAEESNNLDQVLINIADGLDRKTARLLDMMVRMIEPVMLLSIGVVIGFVMMALLLPIFDMNAGG